MRFSSLLLFLCLLPSWSGLPGQKPDGIATPKPPEVIADKELKFAPADASPNLDLPPVTSVPQCDASGALFMDLLESKDLGKHSWVSIKEKTLQRYAVSSISDLHDVRVFSASLSDSLVGLLVRGTRETTPSSPGADKSPAGFPWSSYHNYIAQFGSDGTLKGSAELPMTYQLTRLALFPTGDFLVASYDAVNSAARLLYLDSSGRIVRALDMPASRSTPSNAPHGSVDAAKATLSLMGPVSFTSYNQHVLVWRRGSSDPILDVGPGGSVREVPLQVPAGLAFVEMLPANDRWVAHFRLPGAKEDSPFTPNAYAYYELHPSDASPAAKLTISGDVPPFLACETDGTYTTYKTDDANRMVLFTAK